VFTLCEKLFGRRVSYGHPPSHVCLVSLVLCLIQLCCNCGCGGRVGQGEDRHSPPLVNPLIDERQPYPSPGYVSICMRFLPPSIPTIITWITLSIHDPVCQWTTTSSWGKMIGPLWWAPLSQYILCSPIGHSRSSYSWNKGFMPIWPDSLLVSPCSWWIVTRLEYWYHVNDLMTEVNWEWVSLMTAQRVCIVKVQQHLYNKPPRHKPNAWICEGTVKKLWSMYPNLLTKEWNMVFNCRGQVLSDRKFLTYPDAERTSVCCWLEGL